MKNQEVTFKIHHRLLKNDVIRDQLGCRIVQNNRLSYLYLKNEAIPFDEMPYASSLCGHNLLKSRLNKCLDIIANINMCRQWSIEKHMIVIHYM